MKKTNRKRRLKQWTGILLLILICSGCGGNKNTSLIPDQDYTQLFSEKRLSGNKGDVTYKKVSDQETIDMVIDLLHAVKVIAPSTKQMNKIQLQLNEKDTHILSFWTQKDLDSRTTESVYYLALLTDGHIVYSGSADHMMEVRLISKKENQALVKKVMDLVD